MGDEKPSSVENVTIVGQQLTKEVYSNKELYFNPNGQLAIINVTKPVVENGLEKALEAYKKAFELDPKKVKEVTAALQDINKKYIDEAYNKYSLGNGGAASDLFAKAAEVKGIPVQELIDRTPLADRHQRYLQCRFHSMVGQRVRQGKAVLREVRPAGLPRR